MNLIEQLINEKVSIHYNTKEKDENFLENIYKAIIYDVVMGEINCIVNKKETNFEHYKKEIKEIESKYEDSKKVCKEIIKKFNIKTESCENTDFGIVFNWGISEYQENDPLVKLGFEKTEYNEFIRYFHREYNITIIFYPYEKQYYIKCEDVEHYITPEVNNAVQEKLKELNIIE